LVPAEDSYIPRLSAPSCLRRAGKYRAGNRGRLGFSSNLIRSFAATHPNNGSMVRRYSRRICEYASTRAMSAVHRFREHHRVTLLSVSRDTRALSIQNPPLFPSLSPQIPHAALLRSDVDLGGNGEMAGVHATAHVSHSVDNGRCAVSDARPEPGIRRLVMDV